MKNILLCSCLSILLLCSVSCKKFLDVAPNDAIPINQYYQTEKQLEAALMGVYDILGQEAVYGRRMLVDLTHGNDIGLIRRNTSSITMGLYRHTSGEAMILNFWSALYEGINRANLLLEGIETSSVEEEVKSWIQGQALFLRAYYYFLLVDHWGDVPLKLSSTQSADLVHKERTSAREIYSQILEDMETAEMLLPRASELGPNSSGRISKNTVQGILVRVCLTMAGEPLNDETKFSEAVYWAKQVIDMGENELNPDFAQIFINHAEDKYDIKENLWEVEFFGTGTDNYREISFLGNNNGVESSNVIYPGRSTGDLYATAKLYQSYENDDLRRDRTIAPYQWSGTDRDVMQIRPAAAFYNRFPGKWRRQEETNLPRHANFTGTNFPLLRYSDVLLMYAEALNEVNKNTSPPTEAFDALNQVRKRGYGVLYGNVIRSIAVIDGGTGYTSPPNVSISGGGGAVAEAIINPSTGRVTQINVLKRAELTKTAAYYSTPPIITISGGGGVGATAAADLVTPSIAEIDPISLDYDTFKQAIQAERMRELAFEGLRIHDLRRWGIFIITMQDLSRDIKNTYPGNLQYLSNAGDNISEKHMLFPIPDREMSLNNLIGDNNPGW